MLNPGFKIYEYRCLKKISQADLATRAGLAQANLSNIEKGKRDLTVSTLLRIATALGVQPSVLIEEETPAQPIKLTRFNIEKLGEVVLRPEIKAKPEIKKWAGLFRMIIFDAGPQASSRKKQLAWMKIRQNFSSQEIKSICGRVEDARQRSYAKKTN